ncbi:hypothetical protein F5X99DRAFT_404374 [Biscogniauxia marginata]|nr:hypothetical protein F5X99DRAFT_404374 [Biscogniauxia marginata]
MEETFTPFPRLPPELRIDIWNLAMLEPRLVHMVSWNNCCCKMGPHIKIDQRWHCQVPAFFFVCSESRCLAMGFYSIRSTLQYKRGEGMCFWPTCHYIMAPTDILVVDYDTCYLLGSVTESTGPIRNIMIRFTKLPYESEPVSENLSPPVKWSYVRSRMACDLNMLFCSFRAKSVGNAFYLFQQPEALGEICFITYQDIGPLTYCDELIQELVNIPYESSAWDRIRNITWGHVPTLHAWEVRPEEERKWTPY